MNFAMPVIVSDQVGAGRDLVRENETGYVFPMGQVDRLADMLINVLKHPHERMLMGQNALELVNQYSFEADVDGIVAALHTISSTPI
jgi:glycosyltransferase involved in cell wall biosynthesis